jgi:hypothetical protein
MISGRSAIFRIGYVCQSRLVNNPVSLTPGLIARSAGHILGHRHHLRSSQLLDEPFAFLMIAWA